MFDYVEIANGKLVERIQQSDALSRMHQMYTMPLKRISIVTGGLLAGALASIIRQGAQQTR